MVTLYVEYPYNGTLLRGRGDSGREGEKERGVEREEEGDCRKYRLQEVLPMVIRVSSFCFPLPN